jgi:enoyl-CoA hydratase
MQFILVTKKDGIATITLSNSKVNALDEYVIEELNNVLLNLLDDQTVKAIIITGQGKFFSFGFDIPQFLSYSKKEFTDYLYKFTDLYTYIFSYPKPIWYRGKLRYH